MLRSLGIKRLITLLLSIAMLLAVIPLAGIPAVFAEQEKTY